MMSLILGPAGRESRCARNTYDDGFIDWLDQRTALTPDQEPQMFRPVPLDSGPLESAGPQRGAIVYGS
jgi:hypothetical protein